ncbi:MAG: hypothetical protein J6V83_04150 [Clostridia bacterium]|nr:hypothetical protein [Clostridia bacterium]MBO7156578.1 hypothetical protein [Clostridia bacterium]
MKNKKVAVLDITSDRITLVMQDKYADNFTFRSSQSYDGYYNGEFLCDPSELFKIIESLVTECEKATFTKLTDIMVGVPGEFTAVSCKSVSNTLGMERKVTARDVDVLYEIGKPESDTHVCISASPIYFELEDGTCTITPVGGVTNVLKCLMSYVVCERSFTALFDKISEEIGVKFTYASSLLAEVMYVVPESLRDYGVVLADVGFTSTSVAYARGDGIAHALSFSLGGGHVIGDLYEVKEMPFNHATALLDRINLNIAATAQDEYSVSFGSEIAYYNVNEINEVAIARIENIADMIGRAIRSSRYDISLSTKILLTGSGIASIPGVKECVAKITGRSVEILTPDLMQFNKPKYSSIAGLLMVQRHQMSQKNNKINGLIIKIKEKLGRRKNNG